MPIPRFRIRTLMIAVAVRVHALDTTDSAKTTDPR